MQRTKIDTFEHYAAVVERLGSDGLLLGSYDKAGKANFMTIGWGTLGIVWGLPIWAVLVRPSRYTYECIEHSGSFTVNVPTIDMDEACAICGTRSGRDTDKCDLAGLTAVRGEHIAAPTVGECPIVYECQVVHYNDVLPDTLSGDILSGLYPAGDFHRVYYGKVIAAAAGDVSSLA